MPRRSNSLLTTECSQIGFEFHSLKIAQSGRSLTVVPSPVTGVGLLLREVEKRTGILRRFATCFTDYRNPDLIEHGIEELVAQRVYGLAKDLNDHDELRKDPLLAVLVEKSDPSETLAAKSPLNRLELTRATARAKERVQEDRIGSRGCWMGRWRMCFCRRARKHLSRSFWT